MLKPKKPKYHAGQVLMTDMGNIFTITHIGRWNTYGPAKAYYLAGHKSFNSLPISYIDSSEHLKPATKAGQLLYGKKL